MNPKFRFRRRAASAVLPVLLALTALLGSASVAAADIRSQEWPLNAGHFDARQIWSITRGEGVTVAVVDSGVDARHPDLAGRVLPGAGFVGVPRDDGRIDVSAQSHGTAIASIIAGSGAGHGGHGMAGLAPQARVLPVRVALQDQVVPAALAEGIKYAADHHAQVINVSLSSPDPDPVLRRAVAYAMAKDCVVVAAAGNEGRDGDPTLYPAAFPGVLDVSGVDETGAFWPMSESGVRVALAAPATDIYAADDRGGYVDATGTSYSAAYVSAAAALVRSMHPRYTAAQTIAVLLAAAVRPAAGGPATADEYGYGLLDPRAALRSHHAPPPHITDPLLSARPIPAGRTGGVLVPVLMAAGLVLLAAWGTTVVLRRRATAAGAGAAKAGSAPGRNAGVLGRRPATAAGGRRAYPSTRSRVPSKRRR